MTVNQLIDILKKEGLSENNCDKALKVFIQFQRDELVKNQSKLPKKEVISNYENQIIDMISQHPEISRDTYKSYIDFVIQKLINV